MATFGIFEWQTSALLIGDKYKKEKTYFQASGSIAPRWCTNKGHAKMSKNKTARVTAQLMTWIRANLASYSSICFSPFQRQVPTLINKSCKTCTIRNKRRMVLLLFWKCLPGICYGKWPIDAYSLNILFCFWWCSWCSMENCTRLDFNDLKCAPFSLSAVTSSSVSTWPRPGHVRRRRQHMTTTRRTKTGIQGAWDFNI